MKHCKICSGETEELIIGNKTQHKTYHDSYHKTYHKCQACGFVSMDEKDQISPEAEKKRYLLHDNTMKNKGYVRMLEQFIKEAVMMFAKKDCRVLDYGSGPEPVLAKLLKKKGFQATIHDKYFATEKPKGTFDIITMTETIEHIIDPIKELRKIKRLLKISGVLVIMTQPLPEMEKFGDWHYRKDETHISFFSEKTFEKTAEILEMQIIMHKENIWGNIWALKKAG